MSKFYGTWGYFKENKEQRQFMTSLSWVKMRQRQYIEINKSKYVFKLICSITAIVGSVYLIQDLHDRELTNPIVLSTGIMLIGIYTAVASLFIWKQLPPENYNKFIEYTCIIFKATDFSIYRAVGRSRRITDKTTLYGPVTYQYRFIEKVEQSEDRIVIYFKNKNPYKTTFKTLQNNFESDEVLNILKEEVDRHAGDSEEYKEL